MVDVTPRWGEPRISMSFMLYIMWFFYHIYVLLMCYTLCWILRVPSSSFLCKKCYILCCHLCIRLCASNMLDLMFLLLWTKSCFRPQPIVHFYFDRSPWIGITTNIGISLSLTGIFDVFCLCFVWFAFMWDWVFARY